MAQTPYTVYTESDSLTPDTATNPTSFTGNLGKLVGNLANRIKAITGKASVLDAPATNLEAVNTKLSGISTSAKEVGAIDNGPAIFANITVGTGLIKSDDLRTLLGVPVDAKGVFVTFFAGPQTSVSHVGISSAAVTPNGSLRLIGQTGNPNTLTAPIPLPETGVNGGKIHVIVVAGSNCTSFTAWISGWWR